MFCLDIVFSMSYNIFINTNKIFRNKSCMSINRYLRIGGSDDGRRN